MSENIIYHTFFRSLLNLFTYTPPSLSLFCLYIKLLENMNPYKAMCTSSDIDKINLSFYMPNNFVCLAFLPVRKKECVSVYVCASVCHTTYNLCMFKSTCVYKVWQGKITACCSPNIKEGEILDWSCIESCTHSQFVHSCRQ